MEEQRPKKLLDQARDAIRLKHYSIRTEQAYVGWIKRYIYFHGVRHPAEMGAPEVEVFLTLPDAIVVSSTLQHFPKHTAPLSSPQPVPVGEKCGAVSWALPWSGFHLKQR
jgi:uncharacterized protein YfaA (DUF2138 family)